MTSPADKSARVDSNDRSWWRRISWRRAPGLLRAALLVLLAPMAEYALLVWISDTIGFLLTLALLLGSGMLGAWCVRKQGLAAWNRILGLVRAGEPVGEAIFDGGLIVLAGVLLMTPGVLSDIVGGLLLSAAVRRRVKDRLGQWLRKQALTQVEAFHADGRFTTRSEE